MPKTILQRINHAWGPLSRLLTFKIFGIATVFEALAFIFDWQLRLKEAGIPVAPWVPTVNLIIYVMIVVFFTRAVFLLAERTGESEEALGQAYKKVKSYASMCSGMHDVIHTTRDALLAGTGFINLIELPEEERTKRLWDTWQTQLGLLEKALRKLTDADCSACIKIIKKDGFAIGVDGLSTVCYSPAVSIQRRKKSLVLPVNQGIAQEALITRDIAFSNDITKDPRFWPCDDREKYAKAYQTVVASPILVNGQAHGVLCLDWKEANQYLPDEHHDIIACFTDLISTACYIHELSRTLVEKKKEVLSHGN